MPINFNNVDNIYHGTTPIKKVYRGSVVEWDGHDYFYIENLYNGTNTVALTKNGSPTSGATLAYSLDKVNWNSVTYDSNNQLLIELPNKNQKVYFRSSDGLTTSNDDYYHFSANQSFGAGGDMRKLIDYTNSNLTVLPNRAFNNLFRENTNLIDISKLDISYFTTVGVASFTAIFYACANITDASNLIFNFTTLSDNALSFAFQNCTSLVNGPRFIGSGITLQNEALRATFRNTALVNAPAMNIVSLDSTGTRHMYDTFRQCTSLSNATNVKLNATTLYNQSYHSTFFGCTNLVTPPEIMATTYYYDTSSTTTGSMVEMFYNCSKLNQIKVHFTSWNSGYGTRNWTYGTKSSGTFYKPSSLPSTKNVSGNTSNPHHIPYNWTVSTI